jgi:hypothetical protein
MAMKSSAVMKSPTTTTPESQAVNLGIASTGVGLTVEEYLHAVLDTDNERLLAAFRFNHLQPALQVYSVPFFNLAYWIAANLPAGFERTVALRKLLEAKDAAVRAAAIPELSD